MAVPMWLRRSICGRLTYASKDDKILLIVDRIVQTCRSMDDRKGRGRVGDANH